MEISKSESASFLLVQTKGPLAARQGHSGVKRGNKLFVFGGRLANEGRNRAFTDDFWAVDVDTYNWESVKVGGNLKPSPRHNHSAIVWNDKLYIFGGSGYGGYFNDLYEFDFLNSKWTLFPSENAPPSLHGHSAILFEDNMIVFGGKDQNSKYYNESWSFNFKTNKWSILNTTGKRPHIRCWHTATLVGSNMLVHGGFFWDGHEKYFDDTFSLDLKTLEWKEVDIQGDRPHARNRHSATLIRDNLLFVFGGNYYNDKTRKGAFFDDAWVLDLTSWKWRKLDTSGKVPQRGHHICIYHGKDIILFGGELKRKVFNDLYLISCSFK